MHLNERFDSSKFYCNKLQAKIVHELQAKIVHELQVKIVHELQANIVHKLQAKIVHDLQANIVYRTLYCIEYALFIVLKQYHDKKHIFHIIPHGTDASVQV